MSGDHGVGRMTSDSGNPVGLLAEKARNARLRRLEKQKKNSGMLKCGFTPEIALDVAGEGVSGVKKRRTTGFQDVPSIENRASVEGDVALKQCSSGSSDQSSATDGSPAKHLMRGGEVIGEDESVSLASLLHGSISVIGRRRAMEDAVTVAPEIFAGEFAFFAVYDGHGGAAVASACRDRLHLLLAKELEGNSSPEIRTAVGRRFDWEKVMAACFAKMDEEVTAGTDVPAETVGSTAVVVVVSKTEVVIANCGDSRAVIGRGGAAVPLSHDHKPHRTDERERVEAAGGRVIDWNGCRVQGVLATSRSIGDRYLRPYVISDPEIVVSERTNSDEFLVIATDGLWDVISNETACDVVRKSLGRQLRWRFSDSNCAIEAAAVLAELAIAKGSKDNISVIVVELKKSSSCIS